MGTGAPDRLNYFAVFEHLGLHISRLIHRSYRHILGSQLVGFTVSHPVGLFRVETPVAQEAGVSCGTDVQATEALPRPDVRSPTGSCPSGSFAAETVGLGCLGREVRL